MWRKIPSCSLCNKVAMRNLCCLGISLDTSKRTCCVLKCVCEQNRALLIKADCREKIIGYGMTHLEMVVCLREGVQEIRNAVEKHEEYSAILHQICMMTINYILQYPDSICKMLASRS